MTARHDSRLAGLTLAVLGLLGTPPCLRAAEPVAPVAAGDSAAAEPSSELVAEDLDPTKLVFLNVRLQHDELGGGNSTDFVLVRRDVAVERPRHWKPGQRLALLRFDLPVGQIHLGSETTAGVGDLFAQVLHVHDFSRRFSLNSGLAFVLPTATEGVLGTGKWQMAPTLIPVWRVAKLHGMVFVRIQDFVSFAGDGNRPDLHALTVNPTYLRLLSHGRFVLLDTEAVIDWENSTTSWKSGVLVGRFLRGRRAVWVKLDVPWGENRRGDWSLKTSIAFRGRQ